jgi:hypothetical protein
LKDGVETPLSQLLAAETVEEPSPSWCWSPPPWSAGQTTVDRLELAADGTSTPAVPALESIRRVRTESESRKLGVSGGSRRRRGRWHAHPPDRP